MSTYSKEFIEAFVHAYSRNVACASDEAVKAFLQDFTAGMGWEEIHDKHEYSSNIFDALCMFEAGMAFQEDADLILINGGALSPLSLGK